ncbi:MAG: hypothetical protein ABR950_11435 [Candidatus Dormibacteria bacterium]|jgi:hypothetical protein
MKLRGFVPLLAGIAAVGWAAGCGSTSSPPTQSSSGSISTTASAPAATSTQATSAPTATAGGPLSGTWSGSYSGAFTGTFTLNWTESGSSLSGNIDLSPGGSESISGTVTGSSIQFGAVGSEAITYNGTVSGGASMSGDYSVIGTSGGSWTASKTS